MGAFFTNYQVRTDSTSPVREALAGLVQSRAYVSPPQNGWVTVYDEASDEQDDAVLRRIAAGLSQSLTTAVLAFLVHDSDIVAYWLYRDGKLADEFNSTPDYFKKVNEKTRARLRGNPDALLPLCVPGTTREQLDAVLHPVEGVPAIAEEMLTDLAPLLGVDPLRITLGFNYFDEEGEEMLPDVARFEPVGEGAEQKSPRTPEGCAPPAHAMLPQPDIFAVAIGMLAQSWNIQQHVDPELAALLPREGIDMLKQLRPMFDQSVRSMLKQVKEPGLPVFEELKAARNKGPEALAELLAQRTPGRLTAIGVSAAIAGSEPFIAALLQRGLDPTATDLSGITPLLAAERHGKNSRIYQLLKAAAERGR